MEEALLTWQEVRLGAWLLAAVVGALHYAATRNGWKAAGVALMWVPVLRLLLDLLPDLHQIIGSVLQGGVVHAERSTHQLSGMALGSLWRNLGYPTLGFLLWAVGHDRGLLRRPTTHGLAAALRSTRIPLGAGEARSIAWGLAAFPVLAVANLLLLLATAELSNSDESGLWRNMTPYHAILISAAAAFGEEVLYRGVLQTSLVNVLAAGLGRSTALAGRVAAAVAIPVAVLVQGLIFGVAHAGYANLQHLIFPTLFGLLAGVVAWRYGIWAAIVLHFLIDLFAFGLYIEDPWVASALAALFLALCAFTIVVAVRSAVAWRRGTRG